MVTGAVLAQREDAAQTVPPRFSPNRFVGTLADRVFVAHAAPASRTLALALALRDRGTPVLTVDDPANDTLLEFAAKFQVGAVEVSGGEMPGE